MTKTVVTLEDKYTQPEGHVMLSALQGVVRMLLDQARRDRQAGLKTAGYVTGYRGSPITTLDAQLWATERLLTEHDIRFEPGLNEELAATSLRGTQTLDWYGSPRVSGVFSLWYAKGIGVDRAHEALKMANMEGTSANGGVLVLAGDDHSAKSSATAHQSEHNLIAAMMPVLYPATTDEVLRFGQLGWALSRNSGLYVGLKMVTDTLDLTSTVELPGIRFPIVMPPTPVSLNVRKGMSPLLMEELTVGPRIAQTAAFASANNLDTVSHDSPDRNLTIVSSGKAWLDVCQALTDLGLDQDACRRAGVRVVKFGLIWPIDAGFARDSLSESREILVIEEKRPVLEDQLARLFYGDTKAPAISGKTDPSGKRLLSPAGVLDPAHVREAIATRLEALGLLTDDARARNDRFIKLEKSGTALSLTALRPAYFCSGCPHNISTIVPDGSAAMGATGCHGLAAYIPERRTLPTVGMGSEGMPWVAAQSYVDTPHMFQNLGDGTYTHSGLLSVRASVAANSNVTYKILYNDAVAMTGGQPAEGGLTPQQIVRELIAEGVSPVVVVSDQPDSFSREGLPHDIRVVHRDVLDEIQRELREVKGTSAVIYEQTCANEKRRRRKRGVLEDPPKRLYINPAVCEGCGDCSVQSNCLSVVPIETEFGRKRAIDQSTCNKDYSCIKGYCPAFVTVEGGALAKHSLDAQVLDRLVSQLPAPQTIDVKAQPQAIVIAGVGGTGVLTVGAILAMAAHLEGKSAKVLDQTGMAQKGGAVSSHIRIGSKIDDIPSARLGAGQADLLIACDLVVASGPEVLSLAREDTQVLANSDVAPTGEFQQNRNLDLSAARFIKAVTKRVDRDCISSFEAGVLATRLVGDSIFANLMMVGYAAQKGLLPISLDSIEQAIELNGVAVKANLAALSLGRLAETNIDELYRLADTTPEGTSLPRTYAEITESRAALLARWQNPQWAQKYRDFLAELEQTVTAQGVDAAEFLAEAARGLGKLMAYKDEYEVARLYTDPSFRAAFDDQFAGNPKIHVNLGSPLISWRKDKKTGRPRKVAFGSWIFPVFRVMAAMKVLRGTVFDPFGYAGERRMERALIHEYRDILTRVADQINAGNVDVATEIAAAAGLIAGYGPVKEEGVAAFRQRVAELMPQLNAAPHAIDVALEQESVAV